MDLIFSTAEWVNRFEEVLRLSKLAPGETVLIFTDTEYPYPIYPAAALAAVYNLGAIAYILNSHSDQDLENKLVQSAWMNASLIFGMSFLPGTYSWMYSDLHTAALTAGARSIMVQEPPTTLKRLFPTEIIRNRGMEGAKLLERGKELHIVSRAGTNLKLRKDRRKGGYQCGIADLPGRWDHFPSGMVYCAPLEDSAEGILVSKPGDILLGSQRFATSEIRLIFEEGVAVKIEGGNDARQLEEYLRSVGDEDSYKVAHVGWGTDHRADWRFIGIDSESFYGGITIALGRNIFDSPAPYCGMGGKNRSKTHFDICLRDTSFFIDGQLVIEEGKFIIPELI